MDLLNQYIDFTEGLDFWTQYGLILANFFTITLILIVKKLRQKKEEKQETKQNILFVTAHPDDEAMFFLPTIQNLKELYNLHLLCFSNGDYDGLGQIREKELIQCSEYLGINQVEIINNQNIKDGPKNIWRSDIMIQILQKYIQSENIKGIITFDENGVSGHPNHISVYDAVKCLQIANKSVQKEKQLTFFTLTSVNIFRKYIGVFDFFISAFSEYTYTNSNILMAWKSMKIHHSQFVWYRKLFVIFSRYAYINTLKQM